MEYCGPKGIPHSQFLSWSEDDQDKAIAWMLDERSRCPGCGTLSDEWLDEEGKNLDEPPYEIHSTYCRGCEIMRESRDEIPESRQSYYHLHFRRAMRGKR